MLKKLLKYDLKSLFKSLIPIYLIAWLLALLTRIFSFFEDKISLLQFPAGLVKGLCIVMIIGLPIATFILSIVKYYNNMVKDEGYLTHTLPVKKNSIVLSKIIVALFAMGVSIIASFITIVLAFNISNDIIDVLKGLYKEIMNYDKWIILLIGLSIVISYISNLLLIYLAIGLGQKHNGNKKVYSFVWGIALYNVTQVVSSILLFIPSIFNSKYMSSFDEEVPDASFINGFLIYALIVSILICIVYHVINVKILEKKLNLE